VVRRLAPRDQAWTLGDAGVTPMMEYLRSQGRGDRPATEDEARE
jgi:hypothetical protein